MSPRSWTATGASTPSSRRACSPAPCSARRLLKRAQMPGGARRAPPKQMGLSFSSLRPLEPEVEAPDLELLVRVRRPLDVLLQPVVLVGLDDRDPRQVLEHDPRHLLVGLAAELGVHREACGGAQLVELRVAPVVHRAAGAEQPPHHAAGIAERGGRSLPPPA